MPIIYQYLTREIIRYFAFVMAVVIGIYLVVDFFEKIDRPSRVTSKTPP